MASIGIKVARRTSLALTVASLFVPIAPAMAQSMDVNTRGSNAAPVIGSSMLMLTKNVDSNGNPNDLAMIGVWIAPVDNGGNPVFNGLSSNSAMTTISGGNSTSANTTITVTQESGVIFSTNPATGPGFQTFQVDNNGNASIGGALSVAGAATTNGINNNGAINTTTLNTTGNASIGGTLNMNGNRIQNVGNGVAATDAVNVGQLQASQNMFAGQLQDSQKLLSRGVAATVAMANIPIVDEGKTVSFGVGVGHYNGENGLSVGASYRMAPQAVLRASLASGVNGGSGAFGLGMSTSW